MRLTIVTLSAAIVASIVLGTATLGAASAEISTLSAEIEAQQQLAGAASVSALRLSTENLVLGARKERLGAALEAKAATFDTAVAAANELIGNAHEKGAAAGEVATLINTMVAAQAAVAGAATAAGVTAQADAVTAQNAVLRAAIVDFDENNERRLAEAAEATRGSASGSHSGETAEQIYARYRAILDEVGGSWATLIWSPGVIAYANPGEITIGERVVEADDWAWGTDARWAMRHELAHLYQFNLGFELIQSNGTFQSLYRDDMEALANCMAVIMGSPTGVTCSGERWSFAEAIINGYIP